MNLIFEILFNIGNVDSKRVFSFSLGLFSEITKSNIVEDYLICVIKFEPFITYREDLSQLVFVIEVVH